MKHTYKKYKYRKDKKGKKDKTRVKNPKHRRTYKNKCVMKNSKKTRIDPGYNDQYRGWYDVQKCGKCNDYCRWVGNSGSGGNPKKRTTYKKKGHTKSWWSCWLADASEGKTLYSSNKKWKKGFNYKRCTKEGNPITPPNSYTGYNWNF
jgi:hypothetical protein